jgi:hypothetical protein
MEAIAPRIAELELLVAEYQELRQLVERLRSARTLAPAGAPTGPGEREGRLLALVHGQPGITVPEAAGQLGVEPAGLQEIVRRLQSRYQVIKEGAALYPVGVPED